jgi:hypothetical protein
MIASASAWGVVEPHHGIVLSHGLPPLTYVDSGAGFCPKLDDLRTIIEPRQRSADALGDLCYIISEGCASALTG